VGDEKLIIISVIISGINDHIMIICGIGAAALGPFEK